MPRKKIAMHRTAIQAYVSTDLYIRLCLAMDWTPDSGVSFSFAFRKWLDHQLAPLGVGRILMEDNKP